MTHDERMHQLLYSNEGRVEQCERICRLEELVRDMWHHGMCSCAEKYDCYSCKYEFPDRIEELGVKL